MDSSSDRTDLTFPSGIERCAAWLYRPSGPGPHPCVVLGHGLGAVREMGLDAYAERFRQAGLGALAFDYRHFGASEGEPRQLLDVGRQLEDWRAAVAFARALEWVDPERIAVWGTSFGGGHAIETAAGDPRLAAAVAQCPFTDGIASLRAIDPGTTARLTLAGARDELRRVRGHTPHRVKLVGAPGSTALMTAPDAEPGYRALMPANLEFDDEVAARIALRIGTYRPVRAAGRIRCPLLICLCERDSVAPPGPTTRAAEAAPRGELRRYPVGHFDIYLGEAFERAVTDQIEFLARHLLGTSERPAPRSYAGEPSA